MNPPVAENLEFYMLAYVHVLFCEMLKCRLNVILAVKSTAVYV